MRRLYSDLVLRRVARGDVVFPLRLARSLWRAWRGAPQPLLGTLLVTYRCDLGCSMCDLPLRGDRGRELDLAGFQGVLDAFRDLGVIGVGITGGEPLLRPDLPQIVAHGARLGLLMHVNTNGTLVTEETARALAEAGAASVNVSVDGGTAETHDRLRGRTGSFQRALSAVARLCAVPGRTYRVALTCALGAGNAAEAGDLLERARDLGADRVGFLPVHAFPAGGVQGADGPATRASRRLADRAGSDPLLDNSRAYLSLFGPAFAGARRSLPCTAPRTSVLVDCYGDVYPCVPRNAAGRKLGRGDLRDLWRSEAYARLRTSLRDCRACYWNCHTELDLALRRLGGRP